MKSPIPVIAKFPKFRLSECLRFQLMEKSLFRKSTPESPSPTPYELIEPEIVHLKKGYSIRHGPHAKAKTPPWLLILAFCALGWLYLMDPFYHAWYKGEAIRTYLYLHNYGTGSAATDLIATQIFSGDEVGTLNHRQGSFQDYYASPEAANREAEAIVQYMTNVRLLHAGKYQQLDPVGRMRYLLFIRPGLVLPTEWSFLDPSVGD
jgi:hypothetical protein